MEAIKLNLVPSDLTKPICHASQFDDGREIMLLLMDGQKPYILSDEEIELDVKKLDGNIVTTDLEVVSGKNYVIMKTTEQMCAIAGKNNCELKVQKDGNTIYSKNFYLAVEESATAGGVESESEINNLETQIAGLVEDAVENQYDSENVIFDSEPTEGHGTGYTVTSAGIKAAIDAAGGNVIDDTTSADNKTYSSNKINAVVSALIDDSEASASKVWSSEKVEQIKEDTDDNTEAIEQITDMLYVKYSELEAINTYQPYVILKSGELRQVSDGNYVVKKYSVTANKEYLITACNNWGNLLYIITDENDNLLVKGTEVPNTSTVTTITDSPITMPSNAAYIYLSAFKAVPNCKVQSGYKLPPKWIGKKWVVVGDSLTEVNLRATKRYYDYVSEETGITVVNMGVSDTGYARKQNENKAFYQRISSCPVDADVVTIFGSFNDLGSNIPLGTYTDSTDETIAGCINLTIDNLQAVIPLVNLGIVSPTPWTSTHPYVSSNSKDYVDMLKTICEYRSIPFLNLWECSNLRPWDNSFRAIAYSRDEGNGVHPDENGHKLIAPRFEAFLDSLLIH